MPQRFEVVQKQMQKMVLSAQMQQAIHMLQVPLMELQTIIRQELTTNAVLEELPEPQQESIEQQQKEEGPEDEFLRELDFKEDFEILNKLDEEWKEYFQQSGTFRKFSEQDEEKRRYMMDLITTEETLQDHLLWQLKLFVDDPESLEIGECIIGDIDDNGYLAVPVEEIAGNLDKDIQKVERVLKIIQGFNPVGVGARDLRECLLIQLERLGKRDSVEWQIVDGYLDLLAEHKYEEIAKLIGKDIEEIKKAVGFITTLDPKPGSMFSSERTQYIVPDVFVEKTDGEYVVTLNDERIPHLYISDFYKELLRKPDTPVETKEYIRDKLRSANWLIRNIHQRQQTIYRIATQIVETQREFFEEGPSFLKPLTMQELADMIGLHESTVSRAVANKYMQTPHGIFQMKYFFTSGVKTSNGETVTLQYVKDKIRSLIENEDPAHPLSDAQIAKKLAEAGIRIARRTVSKYRSELNIPSSDERRKDNK